MILAAGLGTRLGALTRDTPKALVDINGTPIIEHVARRLIAAGVTHLIINVHHHADAIIDYVESRSGFGVDVSFSRETAAPLETGGGLLNARPLFRDDGSFFLHNVDVLCAADLRALYNAHVATGALATLAVHERDSARLLLFDDHGLCGRMARGAAAEVHSVFGDPKALAFAGIHVISPALFDMIEERGAFSILDVYLRLAAAGRPIGYHDITGALWLEIGNPERLERARREWSDR